MSDPDPFYLGSWFGEDVRSCFLPTQGKVLDDAWPHPLNTPGPMYVSMNNLVSLAGMERDGGRMVGTDQQYEFFWRQPRDVAELQLALQAADEDEMGSYAWDGLLYWSPLAIGVWWAGRARLTAHLERTLQETPHSDEPWHGGGGATIHTVLRRHLAYFEGEMEQDLRRLAFFLEHRRLPALGVPLPIL